MSSKGDGTYTVSDMCEELGRGATTIQKVADLLGLIERGSQRRMARFTEEQAEQIREHFRKK
jgi:hypothetical protein